MQDNYIHRAFWDAPKTILGCILLFIAGVVFGEGLFLFVQGCIGEVGVYGLLDFLLELLFAFGCGAMLGVGLIFIGIDCWFIYLLMFREGSRHTFFFVIAANQIALAICPSILQGVFLEDLPGELIALLVLWLLYWGSRKLKTRFFGSME